MPTKEEVGRRVRMSRFRRKLTLKDVARRSGMSATHISEIERGKTSPTIGALQRIASALEERPAHFVEERDAPLTVLTRKEDRAKVFICDKDGRVINLEQMNAEPPWAALRVFRATGKPGDRSERAPEPGELVLLTLRGMVKVTVAGEQEYVLREGDTIQFQLANGYAVETLGEEPSEVIGIGAAPSRESW
jgi:transcriptional regulator with XRE-family HTH domain